MQDTLTITDLGATGDGISHLNDGRPVFIPLTVPGDTVKAAIEPDRDGILRGKVAMIVVSGRGRAEPPCRHFGICGGCAIQHFDEALYKSFKRSSVLSALKKAGIEPPPVFREIFLPAATRRRANFAARVTKGRVTIGFHERKSAAIRDVPDCLLITEPVRRVMNGLRPFLPAIIGEGEKMDVLIQSLDGQTEIGLTGKIASGWEAQAALGEAMSGLCVSRVSLRARDYAPYQTILEEAPFIKKFGSLNVALGPGAFLQPSAEGEEALTACVVRGAAGAESIADLFCGHGTFTGPLMDRSKVTAADLAPDAIGALRKAGADARVRDLLKTPFSVADLAGHDCIILDPPRAGAKAQSEMIADSNVPVVVYVSCNPQSFARDAAVLQAGGYRMKDLTLVDQFIWSPHTELVSVFQK